MDRCSGEGERPARANREDVRIPAVGFKRTPHVEHTLSAAHGKVPRHEMNQSRAAVSRPEFREMLCHRSLRKALSVRAQFNPTTKLISPPLLNRRFRKIVVFNLTPAAIRTSHRRSDGFDPFIDEWPQR